MRGRIAGIVAGVVGLGCVGCVLALPYPDAPAEICGNGVDDDLDVRTDCEDPDCNGVSPCTATISWLAAGEPPVVPPAWACPPNWRTVTAADAPSSCDPYPEGGELRCVAGWAFFPGEAACRPLGHACPAGEWADDLPATNVWYVRAGASGGDGTRARPYGLISEAINAAAPTQGIVALAVGTYYGQVNVTSGLTIRGACMTSTHLVSDRGFAMVVSAGAGAGPGALVLADLEIDGGGTAVGVQSNRDLTLRGVVVTNAIGSGIIAYGSATSVALDAEDVIVRHVAAGAGGIGGMGIVGQTGADVRLHRVLVEDVHTTGIAASGRIGSLVVTSVVVRDVHEEPATMTGGRGVAADVPSEIDGLLVERVHDVGLLTAADATIANLVVRDVVAGTFSRLATGFGLAAQEAGVLDLRGALIERVDFGGLMVAGPARATLADVIVRDARPSPARSQCGMVVTDTTIEGERVTVTGTATAGAIARAGGILRLADLRVRDAGMGVVATEGGEIDLTSAVVERCIGAAIVADGRGSSLALDDVLVSDTAAAADETTGYGLVVQNYAVGRVGPFVAQRSAAMGALIRGERATLTLRDVVLRDAPIGLGSYDGARVIASRFLVTEATRCGLELTSGSRLESHGGEVRSSPLGACVSAASTDGPIDEAFLYSGSGVATSTMPLPPPATLVPPVIP